MALKRKRSDTNFSPVSTSSYTSTESRQSQSPIPAPRFSHSGAVNAHGSPSTGEQPHFPQYAWHLNSRTMKRHRDNRPDERFIYESTIAKLFSAQRDHRSASPIPSHPSQSGPSNSSKQKSTLHSFWHLPSVHSALTNHATHSQAFENPQAARCEDCDRSLVSDDAMDVDLEATLAEECACRRCGRSVCDMCAVAADERCCLDCATWGGGGFMK